MNRPKTSRPSCARSISRAPAIPPSPPIPRRVALAVALACGVASPRAALSQPKALAGASDDEMAELRFEPRREIDGRGYVLVGAASRRRQLVKELYGIALYVEEDGAKRAFPALANRVGGRNRERLLGTDRWAPFLVYGDFGKYGVLRFVKPATAAELRAAFEENLSPLLAESAPPTLRDRALALLALLDRGVQAGEELRIHTAPSGRIEIERGGETRSPPPDLRLARALWEIWLGGKPVSPETKRALGERLDVLGD